MPTLIPALTLTLLAAALFHGVFRNGGVYPEEWNLTTLGVAAGALLYWLFRRQYKTPGTRPAAVDYLAAALLAITALQILPLPQDWAGAFSAQRAEIAGATSRILGPGGSITISVVPLATQAKLITLASYVLVFFLIRDLCGRLGDRRWIAAAPLIAIGLLQGTLGLLQQYSGAEIATGTYVNRNHFAGLLEMCLPFAVMLGIGALNQKHSRYQTPALPAITACALLAAGAVMLLGIINSQSRMGFMASLFSFFAVAMVALGSGQPTPWRRWLPAAAVGVLVLAGFIFLPKDQLIQRFASIASSEEISGDTRTQLWRETLPLIADHALTGVGLGGYESAFQRYKQVAPMLNADYAHNDYLQLMAELGVPGFAILLAAAAAVFLTAARTATGGGPARRYLALACVGSFGALFLHSFVDFNLYIPANGMLAAWIGGIAHSGE